MRAPTISTIAYNPAPVPDDPKEFARYLREETRKIQAAFASIAERHDETHVEPSKPREGDERFADGTNWNPGSGKGKYIYYSASWHFMG